MGCSGTHADPLCVSLIVLFRQLGPIVRSPAAASGGGGGQGLLISLLEAFIEAHQADVQRCLSQGVSPATGAVKGACLSERILPRSLGPRTPTRLQVAHCGRLMSSV